MHAKPQLGDIEAQNKWNSGDRVLVLTTAELSAAQYAKIVTHTKRFTRNDVDVFVVNQAVIGIDLVRVDGTHTEFVAFKSPTTAGGSMSLNCAKAVFMPGDRLIVRSHSDYHKEQVKHLIPKIQRWAGQDVEVVPLTY